MTERNDRHSKRRMLLSSVGKCKQDKNGNSNNDMLTFKNVKQEYSAKCTLNLLSENMSNKRTNWTTKRTATVLFSSFTIRKCHTKDKDRRRKQRCIKGHQKPITIKTKHVSVKDRRVSAMFPSVLW